VSEADDPFAHFLLAHPNAPAAEHAFVGVISVEGAAGIYRQCTGDFPESLCVELDAEMLGYLLNFARTTYGTVSTIERQTGQLQLKGGASQPQCLCTFGVDNHAFGYRRSAGGNRVILTFDLHKAQTAGSRRLALFPDGAKVRDVNIIIQSCPQDHFAWGSPYFLAINSQGNTVSFYRHPPLSSPSGDRKPQNRDILAGQTTRL
jgi:hypothetical protein